MTTLEPEPAELPEPTGRSGIAMSTLALVTAGLALLSGGIGLMFDLFPELRPDPREQRTAEVKVVAMEPGVTLGEWLERTSRTSDSLEAARRQALDQANLRGASLDSPEAKEQLKLPGTLFYVQAEVAGLKRERVRLQWSLYDRETSRRVIDPSLRDVVGSEVRLEAPADRSFVEAWTPQPTAGSGRYFARFEVRDREGAGLAIADSPPFRAQ